MRTVKAKALYLVNENWSDETRKYKNGQLFKRIIINCKIDDYVNDFDINFYINVNDDNTYEDNKYFLKLKNFIENPNLQKIKIKSYTKNYYGKIYSKLIGYISSNDDVILNHNNINDKDHIILNNEYYYYSYNNRSSKISNFYLELNKNFETIWKNKNRNISKNENNPAKVLKKMKFFWDFLKKFFYQNIINKINEFNNKEQDELLILFFSSFYEHIKKDKKFIQKKLEKKYNGFKHKYFSLAKIWFEESRNFLFRCITEWKYHDGDAFYSFPFDVEKAIIKKYRLKGPLKKEKVEDLLEFLNVSAKIIELNVYELNIPFTYKNVEWIEKVFNFSGFRKIVFSDYEKYEKMRLFDFYLLFHEKNKHFYTSNNYSDKWAKEMWNLIETLKDEKKYKYKYKIDIFYDKNIKKKREFKKICLIPIDGNRKTIFYEKDSNEYSRIGIRGYNIYLYFKSASYPNLFKFLQSGSDYYNFKRLKDSKSKELDFIKNS